MRIADEAEDLAQLWGTRAGFVVNAVRRDRGGWDHLFEMSLPRTPRPSDPFGLPTCAFTCRIQVKALIGSRRSAAIKLTNWKRAAEDPLPWFFLLIRFRGGEMRGAKLIHMDKNLVERVVGRLCSLATDDKDQLHRKTLGVSWKDGTTLAQPIERSLLRTIAEAIGRGAFEYAKTKQIWYEHAGYKDVRELQFKMSLSAPNTNELCRRLSRAAIGLDELESSQVALTRERFGKAEPLRAKKMTASVSWGESTAREMMLNVHDSEGLYLTTLPVRVRSSTSVFPLPRKFWLLRLQSLIIDWVMDVGAERLRANFKPLEYDKPVSLKALNDNLSFLKCLDDREGQIVGLSLSRDERSAALANVTSPVALSRKQYILAIDSIALWSLLGHIGAADTNILLAPNRVSEFGYAARAMLMSRVGMDAQFHLDVAIEPGEVDFTRPITIVTNPSIKIGAITFIDLVALIAVPIPLPEKDGRPWVRVTPERSQLLLTQRYVGSDVEKFDFRGAAQSFEAELDRSGYPNAIGINWHSFTEHSPPTQLRDPK